MAKQERSNTLSGFEDKRWSVYKTPTNARKKARQANLNATSNGKSNYRQVIGSPFSKIKVKNIVESGSFVKEIKEMESKKKAPPGYKILREI